LPLYAGEDSQAFLRQSKTVIASLSEWRAIGWPAVKVMKTRTLSDYPLLIGELIRRSEIRRQRRDKFRAILKSVWLIK
jgi:hypothetical protein